jgi:hypothetical protein
MHGQHGRIHPASLHALELRAEAMDLTHGVFSHDHLHSDRLERMF